MLGILLADRQQLAVPQALLLGGVAAALGACARAAPLRAAAAVGLVVASGALALGASLAQAQRVAPGLLEARPSLQIEARVAHVRPGARGTQVELTSVRAVAGDAPVPPPRLLLWLPPEVDVARFEPGAWLRARVRLEAADSPRNPGSLRSPAALARRGIGARARLPDPARVVRLDGEAGAAARLLRLRRRLAGRLAVAGEGSSLLRALALGDTSTLDPDLREGFARLGVAHLLAVSGLHLALVAGGAYALTRRALAKSATLCARSDTRDLARVAALVAATGYALLCGFGVPVRRALVLVFAVVASAARARRHPPLQPLAAALLALLAWQPDALFSAGAQLSFVACGALLWAVARPGSAADAAERGTPRWRRRVADAAGASAVATAATAPIAAWHFGVAAPLAVFVNLLAIPWTGLVLLPAALLAAAVACLPDAAALRLLLEVAGGLAAATLRIAEWLAAGLPPGSGTRLPPLALLASGAFALATLWASRPLTRALLATALGAGLWCLPPKSIDPPPPRLVALDVGRGDAVLVQGRRGALLVDAGSALPGRFDRGRATVVPALRALGVESLDLVVATHADLDHRGGLPAVLRALPVGVVWLPRGAGGEPDFDVLRSAAAHARVPMREVGRGSPVARFGDLQVTPLWPPATASGPVVRNERSLALRVERSGRRVLLLGDLGAAEPALLASGEDLRAEVLLLPHHGSRGSASAALLAAVSPTLAILSAPCPPIRGLPHPETLARVRAARAGLWWTGRDGAVLVGLGARLRVASFAEPRACDASVETRDAELRPGSD